MLLTTPNLWSSLPLRRIVARSADWALLAAASGVVFVPRIGDAVRDSSIGAGAEAVDSAWRGELNWDTLRFIWAGEGLGPLRRLLIDWSIVVMVVALLYDVLLTFYFRATAGKLIVRLRVDVAVDTGAGPAIALRALVGRSLLIVLPPGFIVAGVGLAILGDGLAPLAAVLGIAFLCGDTLMLAVVGSTLHDRMFGTTVTRSIEEYGGPRPARSGSRSWTATDTSKVRERDDNDDLWGHPRHDPLGEEDGWWLDK